MPLGQHIFGLDPPLGEHGPTPFRLRPRVLPVVLEQRELPPLGGGRAAAPPQEHGLEQRLGERVALVRHGYGDAEFLADTGGLAQDDPEHLAINRVVVAVQERSAYRLARLAEAVHTALALLMPRGVPRQVVVNDGVEVILQVDSLRQAVGGDQDPGAFRRADPRYERLALFRGHLAGHDADGTSLQVLTEVTRHVMSGRDETTEHHHVEPRLDQLRNVFRGGPELGIAALAREALRLPYQPCQRWAIATDRGLDVVRDESVDVTVEDAIEKILAGLVAEILAGTGAQGQHGRNGARTRCSAGAPAFPRS